MSFGSSQGTSPNGNSLFGNYLTKVTINFAQSAWNTVAKHEVFTVTGLVRCVMYYHVTASLTSGGAATIAFGNDGNTGALAAAQDYTNLITNTAPEPGSTVAAITQTGASLLLPSKNSDVVSADSRDQGYEIAAAAMTGGTIDAYCWWTPLSEGALVVAGTGGVL